MQERKLECNCKGRKDREAGRKPVRKVKSRKERQEGKIERNDIGWKERQVIKTRGKGKEKIQERNVKKIRQSGNAGKKYREENNGNTVYVNCKVGKGKALQYKRFTVNIILTIVQFTILQTFTSKTIGTLPKPTKFPKIISK